MNRPWDGHYQELFEKVTDRAERMLARALGVNMAQYSHGINSTRSTIEWHLKDFQSKPPTSWDVDRDRIEKLSNATMKLGGFLYSLAEGL